VLAETPYINGPWYWQWAWRNMGLIQTLLFLASPLMLFLLALSLMEKEDANAKVRLVLLLLVASNFMMQIMAMMAEPASPSLIREIVASPTATSFYTDALRIQDLKDWMSRYHEAKLHLHSSTHPPGPILFYYGSVSLLGPYYGAYAGAFAIGFVSSLGEIGRAHV
jgi:hypothetical protein